MKKIIITLFTLLLTIQIYAKDQLFFTPYEKKEALKALLSNINNAQNNIDIAIYSFTNHKIAKALRKAAKRGVKIDIIFDEETNTRKNYSKLAWLAKYKNITCYTLKGPKKKKRNYYGKMHMKSAIVDNKKVMYGSINWSNSGFKINYEILAISDDKEKVKRFVDVFKRMKKEAKLYFK